MEGVSLVRGRLEALAVAYVEFRIHRHSRTGGAALEVDVGVGRVKSQRARPKDVHLGVVSRVVVAIAIHRPASRHGLEVQQQAFIDLVEAVGGARALGVAADFSLHAADERFIAVDRIIVDIGGLILVR